MKRLKKKFALLLAVLMVVSVLPMNALGALPLAGDDSYYYTPVGSSDYYTDPAYAYDLLAGGGIISPQALAFGMPGVITPTRRPHGIHDSPMFYTFQIDAAWLSEQPVPAGGRIFLEIETSGGPDTGGQMVGMRGAANHWNRDPMNPVVPNTLPMTFSPGVGFVGGDVFTVTSLPTAVPFTLAMLADAYPALWSIPGFDVNATGNFGGFWSVGSIGNQITQITGLTIQHVHAGGQLQIQFGDESFNGQNPALWPSGLRIMQGGIPVVPVVSAGWSVQNAYWLNYSGGNPITWSTGADAVENLSHIVGTGRTGFSSGPEISYSDRRTSLAVDNRTGSPTSANVWSRVFIDLEDFVVRGGTGAGETMAMSGMINVTIPLQVGVPEGQISIRAGTISAVGGVVDWRGTLLQGYLTGLFANGVAIESLGTVPVGRHARLQPIRITEDGIGNLGNRGLENGHVGSVHTVRLVAPEGFRWDTGAIPGLGAGNFVVRGNATVFGTDPSNPSLGRRLPFFNPQTGSPESVYSWFNATTGRDEIYFTIDLRNQHLDTIAANFTRALFDIEGLSIAAANHAPASGTATVDVWVGGAPNWFSFSSEWAEPGRGNSRDGWLGNWQTQGLLGWNNNERFYRLVEEGFLRRENSWGGGGFEYVAQKPLFGAPLEYFRINDWRRFDLPVANIVARDTGTGTNIALDGPAAVFEATSGRPTGEFFTNDSPGSNARWMQGVNHTIRLTENYRGAMFSAFDMYEIRAVQPGVHIVDAQVRIGTVRDRSVLQWTRTDVTPQGDNANFVASLTEFDGGSMFFVPRTIETQHHSGADTPDWTVHADELFGMDIRLMLSIEAGFEARHGNEVEFEVFRNNAYIGTVHVANVTDPISVTVPTSPFAPAAFTPATGVVIEETESNFFSVGDEIWLTLIPVRAGIASPPLGATQVYTGQPTVNTAESGFEIVDISGSFGFGWRVQRPSSGGVPARITFDDMYISVPPAPPGTEWHIVVHGPQITENYLHMGEQNEALAGGRRIINERARWLGYITGSQNAFTGAYAESRFYARAVFRSIPYSVAANDSYSPGVPTLTLAPNAVTINDTALTRSVTVGGTAAGAITFNRGTLPDEIQLSSAGNTITVRGTPPASGPAISGTYNVVVNRDGASATLAITVNLSPLPDDAPRIEAGTASGMVGDIVTVPISVANNPGIIGLSFEVGFDATALRFIDFNKTPLLTEPLTPIHPEGSTPPLMFTWNDGLLPSNNDENGVIVNLRFEVLDVAPDMYPITLAFLAASDFDLGSVHFTVSNGHVEVRDFIFGDVNNDGNVDLIDVTMLQRYAAGWPNVNINRNAADVNSDGEINIIDVTILQRYVAQWPGWTTLPRPVVPAQASFSAFSTIMPLTIPVIYAGSDATGSAGDTVTVPISIAYNPGIIGMQFSVSFDTTALSFVSHSGATGLLAGLISPPMPSGAAPPLTFTWNDGLAPANNDSDGVVINLTFEILPGASAAAHPITVTFGNANNFDLAPVSFTTANGSVTVMGTHPTPAADIDFVAETLTDLAPGAHTFNGTSVTVPASGIVDINPAWFGSTVAIIRSATTGFNASAAQNLAIPARPNTPAPGSTEAGFGQTNGTITGVTTAMEWRATTGTWADVTDTSIPNLAPGNYDVRIRAVAGTSFASEIASVTVSEAGATLSLSPATANITARTGAGASATVAVQGTATTAITFTNDNTPAWITLTANNAANTIAVTLGAGFPANAGVNESWTVTVNRGGQIATLTVSVVLPCICTPAANNCTVCAHCAQPIPLATHTPSAANCMLCAACSIAAIPGASHSWNAATRQQTGANQHNYQCANCTTRGGAVTCAPTPASAAARAANCTVATECVCGRIIQAPGTHNWNTWGADGASCRRTCSGCTSAETHATASNNANAANCTAASVCTTCSRTVVSAGTHSPTAADCSECYDCPVTLPVSCALLPFCAACQAACLASGGHDFDANCMQCADCGATQPRQCAVDSPCPYHACPGHTWADAWTERNAATCTTAGVEFRVCTQAGCVHEETRAVVALGHNLPATWTVTTPATCTDPGAERRECSRFADCAHYETQVINPLGHDLPVEWTVRTAPCCGVYGEEYRACRRAGCTHELTQAIAALSHTWVTNADGTHDCTTVNGCEASNVPCSTDVIGETCTDCGFIVPDPDCPHESTTATYNPAPTCISGGARVVHCDDCGGTLAAEEVAALGHNMPAVWTVRIAATCTADGEEYRECDDCDHNETRAISALGHDWGEWEVTTAPTATRPGVETRTCANCNGTETRSIPATGGGGSTALRPTSPSRPQGGFLGPALPPANRPAAQPAQPDTPGNEETDADNNVPVEVEFEADYTRRLLIRLNSTLIIDLTENATVQTMDVYPQLVNGRTLIPVRFVAYALGANVDWNADTNEVTLTHEGTALTFAVGEISPELRAMGMDVPAQIIDGRTMVPLRFISEFFGAIVIWDDAAQSIEILQ